ncbi:hypothetical protein AK830_g4542 [Neonectria ditissima]|uniref:Uncharacterized protein n=1 Tax=Neonectria ditissima TaxID=78410 RepID=A0A0P7B654_9HYPO|nr:hypothetical protein AK830_g4542 [Neonectria ditissima]
MLCTLMLLLLQPAIRLLDLAQPKHHPIQRRLNALLLDKRNQLPHHRPRTQKNPPDHANSPQDAHQRRRLRASSPDHARHHHQPVEPHGLQRLRDGRLPRHIDDDVEASPLGGQLLDRFAPRRRLAVVDDVARPEGLESGSFLRGASRRNDGGADSHGELQRRDAHPSAPLNEHPIPRLDPPALQTGQRVPCREPGAGQRRGLLVAQRATEPDEARLREDSAARQCPVHFVSQPAADVGHGRQRGVVDGRQSVVGEVLREHVRDDLVARLERRHFAADLDDNAGPVRARHDSRGCLQAEHSLYAVSKQQPKLELERRRAQVYQDLAVPDLAGLQTSKDEPRKIAILGVEDPRLGHFCKSWWLIPQGDSQSVQPISRLSRARTLL